MNTASMEREAEVRIFLGQCANVVFLLLLIIIMVRNYCFLYRKIFVL